MLTISDLNYLITKKIPIKTAPAKAFAGLNKISGKIHLFFFSEIGSKNNILFAVEGYALVRLKENNSIKYFKKNLVINISDRMHILFTTGVYENITDIVLKG